MLSCIPQRPRPRPAPIPKKRSWNLPDQYPTCEFCTLSGQWMNREKALLACLDQGGVGATGLFDKKKKDFDTVYRNAIPLTQSFCQAASTPHPHIWDCECPLKHYWPFYHLQFKEHCNKSQSAAAATLKKNNNKTLRFWAGGFEAEDLYRENLSLGILCWNKFMWWW